MTVENAAYRDVLEEGFVLHWYEIKSVLGRGAFGVTYLAVDKNLDQLVAIKEYFPREFSSRDTGFTVHPSTGESRELFDWGLDRFIREAQTLAKFKHHNIVRVMSVFELNSTAYMVMEYEQGEDLSRLFKKQKNFSEQALLAIFLPILTGLKLVHEAGFIHRDIKPANIYIREDGSPVLIDFGAARKTVGAPTQAITSLVTHGYAPFEQYNESDEKQGAWTDIYALGACLYCAVFGKLPGDALSRGSKLLSSGIDAYNPVSETMQGEYSDGFLRAIDNALMFHAPQRPQDVLIWADMLSGKIDAPALPAEMLHSSADEDDDATIILTTPPSVPPRLSGSPAGSSPPLHTDISGPAKNDVSERDSAIPVIEKKQRVKLMGLGFLVVFILVAMVVVFMDSGDDNGEAVLKTPVVVDKAQLVELLERADTVRRAGRLLEGEGAAIHFYQQVLSIDPENATASRRSREIIEFYADGIRSDLEEGFYDKAQGNIDLLQAAVADSTVVFKLMQEVRSARQSRQALDQLLEQAEADFIAGRLIKPESRNALMKYRSVLIMAADNPEAQKGIERILLHYVSLAEASLKKGDVGELERIIGDILIVDPGSQQAERLRSENKTRRDAIEQGIVQAKRAFKAGSITRPRNKNALALYRGVLKLDPGNEQAKKGIKGINRYFKNRFNQYIAAKNFESAETVVRKIEQVMRGSRLAKTTRTELERQKIASRPDMEVINELMGAFKNGFESRNIKAVRKISQLKQNREGFLRQFFNNYASFKLVISDFKYIGSEHKATANIALKKLINQQGVEVAPGSWSRFGIVVRRGSGGQWKVEW